jgi:hypothetical protein
MSWTPLQANASGSTVFATAIEILSDDRYATAALYPLRSGFCSIHSPDRTTPRP